MRRVETETSAGTWLRPRELCEASSHFLDEVRSDGHGPYPFTMSVVDGRDGQRLDEKFASRAAVNLNASKGR